MTIPNAHKPGYQHTTVGWIPEEWEWGCFDDVCIVIMDGTHFSPTSKEGPRKYITSRNVRPGYMDLSVIQYISEAEHEIIYKKCPVKKGQVLLTKDGASVGNACLNVLEEEISLLSSIAVLDGDTETTDNSFMLYWLLSPQGQWMMKSEVTGLAITRLTLQIIKALRIPLPPLPEQKKIAEILSTWDRAIEQVATLIERKKLLKKGLMQQFLTGKMRFAQFGAPEPRSKDAFYDYPVGWSNVRIGEVASESVVRNSNGDDRTVLSCSKYDGFVNSLEYFGKKVFSDDTSNYKVVRKGEFGFPANHVEEGSIGLLRHTEMGIVSPIYTVFSVDDQRVNREYLYSVFKTSLYRHIFQVNTSASVDRRGSLRWKDFLKIRIPLPSLAEQNRISALLQQIETEITQTTIKLSLLQEQKRGLMQKLLTGEVRVKV